jgi:hypothetical protein
MNTELTELNKLVLDLLEAEATLYGANVDGGATVADADGNSMAIWTGVQMENLRVTESWQVVTTQPTGARYPRHHPLIPIYQLGVDRLWTLKNDGLLLPEPPKKPTPLHGFKPGPAEYVLDIVLRDEETLAWWRYTFYGVTFNERAWHSRQPGGGFDDNQLWTAQYYMTNNGPLRDKSGDLVPFPPLLPLPSDNPDIGSEG